jgi:glycerol-3-phosphate dehydrogenase subunit C
MSEPIDNRREGSLEAPTRHPLEWRNADFYNEDKLMEELERVFEICHGCRRCFSLCNAFPTLFDAIDESDSMELDGVDKKVYWNVVDHCYLCDICYMTKCPYVPPHSWNVDFPHLMLRAKAVQYKKGNVKVRDRILTSTDTVGRLSSLPVIATIVNAVNRNSMMRKLLEKFFGVHSGALLPKYHSNTLRKRAAKRKDKGLTDEPTESTRGKVALFATCYGNFNEPHIGEDLITVLEHNGIPVTMADIEKCCGMPKLELGDLDAIVRAKETNIPILANLVDEGWDIMAVVPSCVLMFKKELPLIFPDDEQVLKVSKAIFDPFEYFMLRHKDGKFNTDFKRSLGKISYHIPCHLRVQNIGMKTRDILQMVPDTTVEPIERCSGHNGTYAVKNEFHEYSMKICKPVSSKVKKAEPSNYCSDCPMAGHHIENALKDSSRPEHPLTLLRNAYGI